MRIYKEKHITYGFAVTGKYMFAKGEKEYKPYSGEIIFWKGRVYAGKKMTRDVELENLLTTKLDDKAPEDDAMKRDYDYLKPSYIKYPDTPVQIAFRPTEKNYADGNINRHFVKWEENIYEVSKKQFDKIKGSSSVYIGSMYFAKIKWSLHAAGLDLNRAALAKAEMQIEGISEALAPTEGMQIQENLYTAGGEFHMGRGWNAGFTKVADRRDYVGYYHIHPENGPMVGRYHGEEAHLQLVPNKELGTDYVPKIKVPE